VDTVRFNRAPKPFTGAEKREYERLLRIVAEAVRDGDLRTVGSVSTRSAVMNQRLRVRGDLERMRRHCRDVDGLGLVLTHSGTHLGILLAEDDKEHQSKVEHARRLCQSLGGAVSIYRSLGPEDQREPAATAYAGDWPALSDQRGA
jgi:L-threonine kinase